MKIPKPKNGGESKGSYLPSVELKGLGTAPSIKKPTTLPKKKNTLAGAMAKIRVR